MNKQIRKITLMIIAVLIVASLGFAREISIPDITGSQQQAISVPVNIDDASKIAGFQFTIDYDHSVCEPVDVKARDLTSNWMVAMNVKSAGKVKVIGFNPTLKPLSASEGSLFVLSFRVVANNAESIKLKVSSGKLVDSKGKKLPFSIASKNLDSSYQGNKLTDKDILEVAKGMNLPCSTVGIALILCILLAVLSLTVKFE